MNASKTNMKNTEKAYREFEVNGFFFEQTIKYESWPYEYGDGYVIQTLCVELGFSTIETESNVPGIDAAIREASRQVDMAQRHVKSLDISPAAKLLKENGWEITSE